ncbi:MAG: cysteine desulfurase NifS [Fidelibacterota bacterium]
MKRIYLDYSATTPVDPGVVEEITRYYTDFFGNASSVHSFGRDARVALERAREAVAGLINAEPEEIVFTSGGTEADNLAIKGVVYRHSNKKNHIISTRVEHHAVLNTCDFLAEEGFEVTHIPVDGHGAVDPEAVKDSITDRTLLISIIHGNNEVGTINPIEEIGKIARERGVYFHSDTVQSYGKIPIDVKQMNLDLCSISAHKIYGPKGTGALYIRKGIPIQPLNHGGHHERKRRAGTENLPGIMGLAKAARICADKMDQEIGYISDLRDRFWKMLKEEIEGVYLNGHPSMRLPGIVNVSFSGVEGESLLLSLDLKGIAASSGSACSSGTTEPSHVLKAMGIDPVLARGSIRFSLGRNTTGQEIEYTVEVLKREVARLRKISAVV